MIKYTTVVWLADFNALTTDPTFDARVTERIAQGWIPHGGVSVSLSHVGGGKHQAVVMQAMIKDDKS